MGYKIIHGDSTTVLHSLKDSSVHCVVTSPPYWGLRNYQTGSWEGGSDNCSHGSSEELLLSRNVTSSMLGGGKDTQKNSLRCGENVKKNCGTCGAVYRDDQIGIEQTPEEYVAKMVQVFREVRRVLRDDGVLWINLGDSYAGYWGDKKARDENRHSSADTNGWTNGFDMNARPSFHSAFDASKIKPKDLVGIPWMVAFALRSDGWYLRQDCIWNKPSVMPESVTDRCTKSHEYIFLLSKSKNYYYDAEAIKEDTVTKDQIVRDRDTTKLNNVPGRTRMGVV